MISEQDCRVKTTAASEKALSEILKESTSVFFKFFCQQPHEIKWCHFSFRLPLAPGNLLGTHFWQ